jgi:hypothetical protein
MTLSFAERDLGLLNISLEDGFINLVFLFLKQTLFVKFFTNLSSIEWNVTTHIFPFALSKLKAWLRPA